MAYPKSNEGIIDMRSFRKNKRGIAEEIGDTAFALLVLFLGILFMTYLTKENEQRKTAEGEYFMYQAIAENNFALYLKQPVLIEDSSLTMVDLIVLAYENGGSYEEQWQSLTKLFFLTAQKKTEITIQKQGGRSMSCTATAEDYQSKEKIPGRNLLYNLVYPNRNYFSVTSTHYLPAHGSSLQLDFKIWIKRNEATKAYLVN